MRTFAGKQRTVLFLAANGHCQACGKPLEPGWHADHVRAWTRGGATDVANGQALCPSCNLRKGSRFMESWPEDRPLRDWQHKALRKYLSHSSTDFLAVATPGSGKTTFALRAAHENLRTGRISRVVIVVPTEHLKKQWAESAAGVGVQLDPTWTSDMGGFSGDYHGVVVTFAAVSRQPEMQRYLCRVPTLVVLDEIHHAGDELSWGSSLQVAYEHAARRLLLSGTPFRSDNLSIPFVRYEDGASQADFSYGYGEALADDVCRPVIFPKYEGRMHWYSRSRSFEATFGDELSQEESAKRLRTALHPGGEWIREVIRDADAQLRRIRETQPDAAGLIVTMDKGHAVAVAEILRTVTGEVPIVVTCDDPKASDVIAEFRCGRRPWIVAVKMVSEGVDIPRLRVGVYATNTLTEMFFRQVVGRFVRMQPGVEDQNAYLYIPRDPTLIEFAQKIKEERNHQLEEEIKSAREESEEEESPCDDKAMQASLFLAISSTGTPDGVIYDHTDYTQSEIRQAEMIRNQIGAPASYDAAILAKFARELLKGFRFDVPGQSPSAAPQRPATGPEPIHKSKERIRKIIQKQVGQLVAMTDGRYDYSDIYSALMKQDGMEQRQCTLDQLKARMTHLEQWIKAVGDGR